MKIDLTPSELKLLCFLLNKALDYGEDGPLVMEVPCKVEQADGTFADSIKVIYDEKKAKRTEKIISKLPTITS